MSQESKVARLRRAKKARAHIKRMGIEQGVLRLSVHRSMKHIYVQLIEPVEGRILASASSLSLKDASVGDKKAQARAVGTSMAEKIKALALSPEQVIAFDRSGFKYHGRIAQLADGLRAAGVAI